MNPLPRPKDEGAGEYVIREPGWPHGPWASVAHLRHRSDAAEIEGQQVMSGRWKPITDPYWDTCVIQVVWRKAASASGGPTDE